jgi:hypothetical protein
VFVETGVFVLLEVFLYSTTLVETVVVVFQFVVVDLLVFQNVAFSKKVVFVPNSVLVSRLEFQHVV